MSGCDDGGGTSGSLPSTGQNQVYMNPIGALGLRVYIYVLTSGISIAL